MLIDLLGKSGIQVVRIPFDGSPEQLLAFPNARLAFSISPNAIRSDGVIAHPMSFGEFNWGLGLLHPDSGQVDRVPLDPSFDVHFPGFLPDGQIVVSGYSFN